MTFPAHENYFEYGSVSKCICASGCVLLGLRSILHLCFRILMDSPALLFLKIPAAPPLVNGAPSPSQSL